MRVQLGVGFVFVFGSLGACSGETTGSSSGTGGTSNATGGTSNATGGTSNATGGTSNATGGVGGAAPAAAAVGLSLSLSQTASCPILPGVPDDIGNPPPNSASTGTGQRISDGEGGLSVACTVKAATAGSFQVQAAIASSDPRVSVSIMGSVDATGSGTATIGISASALPADVLSPPSAPCSLTVVPSNGLAVKAGAIWARFSCATLASPPTYNCVASGEVVLENCAR